MGWPIQPVWDQNQPVTYSQLNLHLTLTITEKHMKFQTIKQFTSNNLLCFEFISNLNNVAFHLFNFRFYSLALLFM